MSDRVYSHNVLKNIPALFVIQYTGIMCDTLYQHSVWYNIPALCVIQYTVIFCDTLYRHYVWYSILSLCVIQYTGFLPNTECTVRNYFTSLRKLWLSLGWYLCTTSYTEFHENLTTHVVPATRSHSDGRLDIISTQDFNVLTRKEAWNIGLWNHNAPHAWLAISILNPAHTLVWF